MALAPARLAALTVLCSSVSIAAAQDFSGPYIGVEAGYSRFDGVLRERVVTIPEIPTPSHPLKDDAFAYEAVAGWMFEATESFYLGGEFRIGGSGAGAFTSDTLIGEVEVEPGLRFDASARAGAALTPSTLVYGRVGYERLDTDIIVAGGVTRSRAFDGVIYGGGVEQALSDTLSFRIDATYADYGDIGVETTALPSGEGFDLSADDLRITGGIILRF